MCLTLTLLFYLHLYDTHSKERAKQPAHWGWFTSSITWMIGRVGEREISQMMLFGWEQCINCVCFHFISLLSANGSRLIITGVFGFVLCDLHMLPMLGVIGRVVNICIYLLGLCSRATTASVWVHHTRSGQVQDPWMQRITVHLHVSVCSSTPHYSTPVGYENIYILGFRRQVLAVWGASAFISWGAICLLEIGFPRIYGKMNSNLQWSTID